MVNPLLDEPTGSIAPGGTVTGVIDSSGDVDAFTINLVAGQTYAISLRGTGETPLADAFLTLSNSVGTVVAGDDDGGQSRDSLLTFTATATGTYTIAAEGYPGDGQTGGYTLDVRQMGTDSVGSTIATAQSINVDQTTFGFLETRNDVDMFAVTLEAGSLYTIDLAGGADYDTNPSSVPTGELDTLLTIYDSAGNQVAFNDDISFPDDISSSISFTADVSGTYYIKVDAYPRQTGGFTLDVTEIDLDNLDPLDSIDWGTQLPSNVVTVFFAPAGQTFDGVTSLGWTQYEIDQAMAALETWADVSNLSFSITNTSASATFKLVTTNSNDFLGYFNPPGETNAGVGVFAVNGDGWDTTGGLEPGGYGWITLVHEFGHGLGLAHPHDNGGGSEVMPGVTGPFDSFGVFDLNQGVYTTMSYNDGWQLHPGGTPASLNYGWQAGPGAFDIALIQVKYGASTANTGDNVYVLPTANAAGTFWDVIWDTGGTDTIAHTGLVSATIDLTAATLDYSPTGAGVISYVTGIFGGFTIAAGVVIENATGGGGADVLVGNSAANILDGGAGNDTLQGNGGADTFLFGVGDGMDTVTDLAAGDTAEIRGYVSAQSVTQSGADVIVMLSASDQITFQNTTVAAVEAALQFPDAPPSGPTEGDDTLTGTEGDDVIDGLGGNDTINGLGGNDILTGGLGDDMLDGGAGNDTAAYSTAASRVVVSLSVTAAQNTLGAGSDTLANIENLTGSAFADSLTGNSGANLLSGLAGNDVLTGAGGNDTLDGGDGADTLVGGSGNDTLVGGGGNDKLDGNTGDDAMAGGAGNDAYYVDSLGDALTELAGEGTDTVNSAISFTLGDNFETLKLTGSGAIDGTGNALANTIRGNAGANQLLGLDGADDLYGNAGNDRLEGGSGRDVFTGGTGADAFVFRDGDFSGTTKSTCDNIKDFSQADGDTIDLGLVDADTLTGGDQGFAFIGTDAFTGTAGELRYQQIDGATLISGDTDGDGSADFMVRLVGTHTLTSSDFVI